MSLKGVVEFALHVEGFRNIDLFHQGLYYIKFKLYHLNGDQKIFANPYQFREYYPKKKKEQKPIIEPKTVDSEKSYLTRTFLIRFCDEEVDLNEVCHFRTEYDAYPNFTETDFFMEAELMFADLQSIGSVEDPDKISGDLTTQFKSVSTFKSRISHIYTGVHEYVQILFDDQHFCILHTMFHATLVGITGNFKFRTGGTEMIEPQVIESPTLNGVTNGPSPKPSAKNFADFLAQHTSNFKIEEIEKFYGYYIKALKISYEKMIEFYAYILRLCFNEQNKNDFQKFLDDIPAKANIEEYVTQDKKTQPTDSELKESLEESKHPPKPKKLYSFEEKKISELANSTDPHEIANAILDVVDFIISVTFKEVNSIATNAFKTWYIFIEMALQAPKLSVNVLREEYHLQLKARWNESIVQQYYKSSDLTMSYENKIGENHKQIATTKRTNLYYKTLDTFHLVEDMHMFPPTEFHPIVFEEVCIKETVETQKSMDSILSDLEKAYKRNDYKGVHLIVLCHGFQGNSFDMRLFKNNISLLYPDTLFLCASSNEDMTDGEISDMGLRLAGEVINYVQEWIPGNNLGRLSFIGHSLGGLIIRAALPYLEEYSTKMHLFMTLSSAHLGYMYHSSKIIDAGMWFLKKWKKSKCLSELSMTDTSKIEESYLYKLSKAKGLGWFKHIALLSSFQDTYAPFESARIQVGKQAIDDNERGKIYAQMAKNILSNLSINSLYRIDVNFKIPQKNIDTMIGRAAHIQFLESQVLMRMLVYRYPNFFS